MRRVSARKVLAYGITAVAIVATGWHAWTLTPAYRSSIEAETLSSRGRGDEVGVVTADVIGPGCSIVVAFLPSCEYCDAAARRLAGSAEPRSDPPMHWVTTALTGAEPYAERLNGIAHVSSGSPIPRELGALRVPTAYAIEDGVIRDLWLFTGLETDQRLDTACEDF